MSRPLVLFARGMKTASTLLHCMVENTLGKEAVISFGCHDWQGAAAEINRLREPDTFMASAHMPFGAHRRIEGRCEYVTLLRDPVDRVASLYHHVQMPHLTDHWLHRPGATLAQWFDWQRREGGAVTNAAVRNLAGHDIDNGQGGEFAAMAAADLELAQQNLRAHFPVVGVMERFEPFLRAFEARHELAPHHMGHVNGRRGVPPYGQRPTDRQTLPPDLVAAIDADNELDLELYRFARDELAP